MLAGIEIGPDGVDHVVDVVCLHRQRGESVQSLLSPPAGALVQQNGLQRLPLLKIIQGRAVAHNARRVHGHLIREFDEGRQRPAGGDGKSPAAGHEILQRLPVPAGHLRHLGARAPGRLRIQQGIVKIAGQQYTVKFSHKNSSILSL